MAGYDGYEANDTPQTSTSPSQDERRQKIIKAYQDALGRDPESEAIIQQHLNNPGGVEGAMTAIYGSQEARQRRAATPTGTTTPTDGTQPPPQQQVEGLGLPTPERMGMPTPTAPTPYSSTYQSTTVNPYTGYGEADRNRLMSAILQSPETMGQTQQDQLFEQQKELLNAQRQQQTSQLQQALLQRGLSPTGGTALAGQAAANQDFTGQLLAAQRDIAVKATQQNRADQLAALQMQEALASGDYAKMMGVYQANQQERMNTENFLRQAQELTQTGQLQYNAQDLASAVAQQREMMDYYTFLENQRNAQNQLNYNYWSRQLAAMGY